MELENALAGRMAEIRVILDAAAPEIAGPRPWYARLCAFFAGLVV